VINKKAISGRIKLAKAFVQGLTGTGKRVNYRDETVPGLLSRNDSEAALENDSSSQTKTSILDTLKLDQAIKLARKKAKEGSSEEAKSIYQDILDRFPKNKKAIDGIKVLSGLPGTAFKNQDPPQDQIQAPIDFYGQGKFQQALEKTKQLLQQFPNSIALYNLLGAANAGLRQFDAAIDSYKQALKIKPDFADGYYNMGKALKDKGDLEAAIDSYKQALKIKPDYAEALINMGNALKKKGDLEAAIDSYKEALKIKPNIAEAYNNMGNALYDKGELEAAIDSFKQALKVNPDYAEALWNLSGTVNGIKEAGEWIKKCLAVDQKHEKAKITHAALNFYHGDKSDFDDLIQSELKDHPLIRSYSWVFSLPEIPSLYFNRWALFDAVVEKSIKDRPFYEYGVWRGEAFKYLIRTFKKGYGFDTFTGLPEDWHDEKTGSYSSDGNIPKIEGGEFIVGKFEESLPIFFSDSRPMASIINFDADLYSSTICALNYSKPVIDRHTILIFDELIMNKNWEQDEFKALNEFCSENDCTFAVVAICFFTKQVAVKLVGI
jgi:tetratricopeptide (TPR) repeat protein